MLLSGSFSWLTSRWILFPTLRLCSPKRLLICREVSPMWRCIEDVLCICIVGENVEVAINYVLYVVVKRVIGQCERNAVVAGCVVRWKKCVILRKILHFIQCCLSDVFRIAILFKEGRHFLNNNHYNHFITFKETFSSLSTTFCRFWSHVYRVVSSA